MLSGTPAEDSKTRETLADGPRPQARIDVKGLGLTQHRDPKRYVVLGEHGRGGLGRVLRAHDRDLGRDVAIKELISRGHIDEVRFLREALITARLEHPGIVAVHEAGRWPDGTPFYAMKLVSGRPLRDLIVARKTTEERIALLHHVIAVADAMAYAHGRHIVHRDLKPGNIIVGDFGETVVIDWGLAKDLTATDSDDGSGGGGKARVNKENELTTAGSVLGTPAYMAPEQERGDAIDQRVDVYAIGMMLWELGALNRSPPEHLEDRQRTLRRAGIDHDLIAIITKAIDPDPACRYPDAGALATDLKAFKSGARITARNYTLLALLAHWIRRHRALAVSISTAVVLLAAGGVLFVRNIAIERDRADTALAHVEAANNNLTLEHAELLLHTDPTAALAALAEYHGADEVRRRRLVAEARGRGVARAIYAPHSDTVWFLEGDRSGAIVSLGEDRRIQLTQGTISTTLATDVLTSVRVAYAPSQRLLAYATSPKGIAVMDLRTRTARRVGDVTPEFMDFAPDGSRLAAVDGHGEIVVWSLRPQIRPVFRETHPGAISLRFMTAERLIVQTKTELHALALDTPGSAAGTSQLPDIAAFDVRPDAVIAGTRDGNVAMLSPALAARHHTSVCHKQLRSLRFIPQSDRVAFACQDGTTGVARYDAAADTLTVTDSFATHGAATVVPDFTGRYVVVTDESNTAHIYDTETRLLSHYDGNAGQPVYVAVPTSEFDRVLIGDVNGTVREWDRPTGSARVVLQAPDAVFRIAFLPDSKTLFGDGNDAVVRRIDIDRAVVTELRGHSSYVYGVRVAPDGSSVASTGYDGTIRAWRSSDGALLRRFAEHGSQVEDVDYIEHGRRIVSVGDDGRLLAWSPEGSDVAVLFQHTAPLTSLEALPRNDHLVIGDAAGTVWDVSPRGAARKIRDPNGGALTVLRASPDGNYVVVATEPGLITVYDTTSWQVIESVKGVGGVRQIAFDPKDRDLLVAWEAGHTQFGQVQIIALGMQRPLPWHQVAAAVRDVAYAPDGETIGLVTADGGTWLYAVHGDTWAYSHDHDTDVFTGRFSPDGKLFATSDRRGVVVVRDVAATLRAATN
ncbi:MAG: hypothetical protein E6J91_48610 [Deltaproteobacteria bacterium]|nr:MAG: hypothetical protein E6J91_48610 [Deltaproteobacteria bacterium]